MSEQLTLDAAAAAWLAAKREVERAVAAEKAAREAMEAARAGTMELELREPHVSIIWSRTSRWSWDSKRLKAQIPNWQEFGSESSSERITVKPLEGGAA